MLITLRRGFDSLSLYCGRMGHYPRRDWVKPTRYATSSTGSTPDMSTLRKDTMKKIPITEARVAVVGGRNFTNYTLMKNVLDSYHSKHGISIIISGGANGADTLAEKWARERQVDYKVFVAKWDKYGKSAGYRRNIKIVDACDIVIAFPDDKSKGTYHTIELADKALKPVWVFNYTLKGGIA